MIPQRVKLKGFLCYKEEQEIAFSDRSLWMLAGTNGSGKSAVFDAVTYAVFGHHRGGSQHAGELINKDSNGLAVEFDFVLDGELYRARRTVQRNPRGGVQGTQLLSRRQSTAGNGQGTWIPVDGTSRKTEFDAWVRDNIGLNYETFTSSVLLLQGNAEKLLSATAKGRFEVLAGIVDLEHYERLHRRADDERKNFEATLKNLRDRLTALPDISADAEAEVDQRVRAAEEARRLAQAEAERCLDLEYKARQWDELQTRLATAQRRRQEAQTLLADAPAIEKALSRLAELKEALPHVQVLVEQRQQIVDSNRKSQQLNERRAKLEAELETYACGLEQTVRKRASLQNRAATEEERRREIAARFREAAALLEKVKEYERQQSDLARVQEKLSRLPADPAAALRAAQAAHDAIALVAQAAPLLARLQEQREQLRAARTRGENAARQRESLKEEGSRLAAAVEKQRPVLEEAVRLRQQADDQAVRDRTLLEQARQDVNELSQLAGAKVCRHCGQALTPGHMETETARRRRAVNDAEEQYRLSADNQKTALERERSLREEVASLEKQLQTKREEYREQHLLTEQASADGKRLHDGCSGIFAELAEPFRTRIAVQPPSDWLETVYPTVEELAAIRKEADSLAVARQRLHEADALHHECNTLRGQEQTVRQAIDRIGAELPAGPETIHQDYVRLEAEDQALDRGLSALRLEEREVQKEQDRLVTERERLQQQVADVCGALATEERARQQYQQTIDRADKQLTPAWRTLAQNAGLAKLYGWIQERDELLKQQVEERSRQLAQARLGMEVLQAEVQSLISQQDAFPAEARQQPAILQSLLQQAREAQRRCDDHLREVEQERALLESHRQQRRELHEQIRKLEGEHVHAKLLAELLGRDRLQLHLVRQAERQVVDYANAVLDRLSGGQLYLRLCGEAAGDGNTAKALELESYNRLTGERPINVAFLSGSQKFRVAVSLALGIGQYASRQHRPIESVIIDEGFGCLDKEGRQVMIQELQNLRGHLRCILLVSHQEEFASAFADGYRFELTDGATRVTRFQP